jgi:NADH:ubiquinone oxidoreductase subunit K
MNRANTTRWKLHFFPLGMAFLVVGTTGLLQAADLVPNVSSWRSELLALVAVLFFVVQSTRISQAREGTWIWLMLLWIAAGILRIGGLTLCQLYPLFMAFLGCSLLFSYAKTRVLAGMKTGATNE